MIGRWWEMRNRSILSAKRGVNGVATTEEPAEIARATEEVIQRSGDFSRTDEDSSVVFSRDKQFAVLPLMLTGI